MIGGPFPHTDFNTYWWETAVLISTIRRESRIYWNDTDTHLEKCFDKIKYRRKRDTQYTLYICTCIHGKMA